jgi:twinkle protein
LKTYADFNISIPPNQPGPEISTQCPACSPTRKKKNATPLRVNIDKGKWFCHHCSWAGGLDDGVKSAGNPRQWANDDWRIPDYASVKEMPSAPLKWFFGRGITKEVLTRNDIGYGPRWMPQVEAEVNAIMFPFKRNGIVVNIKSRDGSKNFRQEAGCERILYGMDDMSSETIWVEGEMDKLSLEVAGYKNCVSVPDGAPSANAKNYDSKFDFLANCSTEIEAVKIHIIAVDNDEPGLTLQRELVRRLGAEFCKIVEWPEGCKDANDVLLKHGMPELQGCIETAKFCQVDGIFRSRDIIKEIGSLYFKGNDEGIKIGLGEFDDLYRVRAGELTIVTGIPGSGKSEFMDQVAINLAKNHGWHFGLFSPENQPVQNHIIKLIEKMAGKPFFKSHKAYRMGESEVYEHVAFCDKHIFQIDPPEEEMTIDGILKLATVCVRRHGIKGLIIDPWNEIEHRKPANLTETEYISATLSKVRRWGRTNDVHVWIVAHPTKMQKDKDGKYPVPTPYDISGGAHWRNKADYALTVHRGDQYGTADVYVQKVRFKYVGRVGAAKFSWCPISGRYECMNVIKQGGEE